MLQIGFATLYTEPRRVTEYAGISPLWLGDALTNTGDVRIYLKEVTYPELIAECLCATLGSAIGLPVLQTYVVRDPDNILKASYLIGSEDADMPSFKRHLQFADKIQQQAMVVALTSWRQLHESALFDEWTANPDRNTGNLLWDGGDEWHLIDHGRALWTTTSVNDSSAIFTNIFAGIIKNVYQELGIAQLKKKMAIELPKYQAIETDKILLASRCSEIGCVTESQNKLVSLVKRINMMPGLVARHSDQPELF